MLSLCTLTLTVGAVTKITGPMKKLEAGLMPGLHSTPQLLVLALACLCSLCSIILRQAAGAWGVPSPPISTAPPPPPCGVAVDMPQLHVLD